MWINGGCTRGQCERITNQAQCGGQPCHWAECTGLPKACSDFDDDDCPVDDGCSLEPGFSLGWLRSHAQPAPPAVMASAQCRR
jgi:hypothetical protein